MNKQVILSWWNAKRQATLFQSGGVTVAIKQDVEREPEVMEATRKGILRDFCKWESLYSQQTWDLILSQGDVIDDTDD